ncbi:MAG: SpoIIE family protein phosphatase [Acidimicrobiia bacterium]
MPGDRFIELATAEDRKVLDVLFRHASEAVTVQDRSGRLLYANDGAAQLVGFAKGPDLVSAPVEQVVGLFELVDRNGAVIDFDDLPGRRVLEGEPFVEEIVGYRRKGSRTARWSRVHASPIKNDAGEVVWAINFFLDITDQVVQEEAQQLLANVYEVLGSSLDREENLHALAAALVPRMGSWCSVHLIEHGDRLVPVASVHPDTDEARNVVQMAEGDFISMDDDRMQARVARARRPELLETITEDMLEESESRAGKDVVDLVRRLDLNSVACVPMSIGRLVVGTLTVARSNPDPHLERSDLDVLSAVAERAAATLENAGLYQQQVEIAETLQSVLLPKSFPTVDGLEFATRYRPLSLVGHVGGDFYDIVTAPGARTAVLLGDIAGKGVDAAAAVGVSRYTLRSTIALEPAPETVLGRLNTELLEEGQMCTLAYLQLEHKNGSFDVEVTLAGHPPPIRISADGQMDRLGQPCPPVGIITDIRPIPERYTLAPGDTVVLYSDGYALPGLNPPESVELALSKCKRDYPELLLDQMMTMLFADSESSSVRDDIALLALRVTLEPRS